MAYTGSDFSTLFLSGAEESMPSDVVIEDRDGLFAVDFPDEDAE